MRADDVESAVAVRDEVVVVELKDLSGALIELLKERCNIRVGPTSSDQGKAGQNDATRCDERICEDADRLRHRP